MRTRKLTQAALAALIVAGLTGCLSGGSADSGSASFPNPAPVGESFVAEVHAGNGFECFCLRSTVYCRGASLNLDLDVNSVNFTPYFTDSDSNITRILTYDDTLLIETSVATRPSSGTSGVATYYFGEATFAGSYSGYPMIYVGTPFFAASYYSSDVSSSAEPFAGGDLTIETALGGTFLTDGTSQVIEREENCTLNGTTLTCETFTADVLGD